MKPVQIESCPWCGGAGHMLIEPMWRGSHGYYGCYSWEVRCVQCGAAAPNGKFDNISLSQEEAALYAGEKEAEMNKRISEALTPELIKYYYIKQWNGKLSVVSTDNTMTLIDMNDINKVAD